VLARIGLTKETTKESDDLRELPRNSHEQQDDHEQIGELSHQLSLGAVATHARESRTRCAPAAHSAI